ncbi:MAG: hypothetical protein Q8K75_07130 [Chlamydiales bacterium]|nr:hypothetical protein [Chlamydiales bacterium]
MTVKKKIIVEEPEYVSRKDVNQNRIQTAEGWRRTVKKRRAEKRKRSTK